MKAHGVVFKNPELYAGWPANHGGWQWDNEVLIGFMTGAHASSFYPHAIGKPFETRLSRSVDSGKSWEEVPSPDFLGEDTIDGACEITDETIFRFGGCYDQGGISACHGTMWLSNDRGSSWKGPIGLSIDGVDFTSMSRCTTRTAVLGGIFFFSQNFGGFGTDKTFTARRSGSRFILDSFIVNDGARAVMPSACVHNGEMHVALRRADASKYWIDLFRKDHTGWTMLSRVCEQNGHNGNPPALVSFHDELWCFWGHRSRCSLMLSRSCDHGSTWSHDAFREGRSTDIGYPKAFSFQDHVGVAYYWSDDDERPPHIAWSSVT